jgi:c(7)-type cytochrome triheme protein
MARARWSKLLALAAAIVACALALAQAPRPPAPPAPPKWTPQWLPLAKDGVHDPKSPALAVLQQPAEALAPLPRDTAGNLVDWVKAIESGAINPRTNLLPETVVRLREDDIIVSKFGSMDAVKFPHRAHTLWLDCANCHEKLFKSKAGANRLSMQRILDGEQCGVCHGAVAFPLTECRRCHNTSNASLMKPRAAP